MSHAALSPSAFKRVIQCPASLIANLFAVSPPNEASERGSYLHALAENMVEGFAVESATEADISEVTPYVNYCNARHFSNGTIVSEIERRVDLSCITDKISAFGTVDFLHYDRRGILEIVDLKTGRQYVDHNSNPQLSLYAIGAVEFLSTEFPDAPINEIRLTIHQDGTARTESISLLELEARAERYRSAVKDALSPNPIYRVGPECRYCPYQAECPAKAEEFRAMFDGCDVVMEDFMAGLPATTSGEMVEIFAKAKTITAYLNAVEAELSRRVIVNGETIGGIERKATKGRAQWIDEAAVTKYLFDTYPADAMKFLRPATITELRELLGPKTVAEFTQTPSPSVKIVLSKGG